MTDQHKPITPDDMREITTPLARLIALETIDKPFCFLSEKMRQELIDHGGPYEVLDLFTGEWGNCRAPSWFPGYVYRVKPQPNRDKKWLVDVTKTPMLYAYGRPGDRDLKWMTYDQAFPFGAVFECAPIPLHGDHDD